MFTDEIPPEYLSHAEKYENEIKKSAAIMKKIKEDDEVQRLVGEMEGIR